MFAVPVVISRSEMNHKYSIIPVPLHLILYHHTKMVSLYQKLFFFNFIYLFEAILFYLLLKKGHKPNIILEPSSLKLGWFPLFFSSVGHACLKNQQQEKC
jgi:hypothetical protein